MPDESLNALVEEYWDTLLEANPTGASVLGDHRFDDRIDDLSAAGEAEVRARWESMLDRATAVDRGSLDVDDAVTQGQLIVELGDAISLIDTRQAELRSFAQRDRGLPVVVARRRRVRRRRRPGRLGGRRRLAFDAAPSRREGDPSRLPPSC